MALNVTSTTSKQAPMRGHTNRVGVPLRLPSFDPRALLVHYGTRARRRYRSRFRTFTTSRYETGLANNKLWSHTYLALSSGMQIS